MALKINVTWPRHLPQVCIPIDCRNMRPIFKATKSGDHIVIDGAFGCGNRVCDDDRYRISGESQGPLKCCQPYAPFDRTLVILLESPHKDEYGNDCIDCPKKPAQGTTGNNVRDHLMNVIRSCRHIHSCLGQETRVILANPIQFQCSLVSVINSGAESDAWKKTRDAVWKALWDIQAIQDEFRVRLDGYDPDFIINACTHDLECNPDCLDIYPECRKRKVHDFLVGNFPDAHIYAAAVHPVTWHIEDRRGLRLVQERRPNQPGTSTGTNGGQG